MTDADNDNDIRGNPAAMRARAAELRKRATEHWETAEALTLRAQFLEQEANDIDRL